MYLFTEKDNEEKSNLKSVDDLFLNLHLFMNESGSKERWIFNIESVQKAKQMKDTLLEIISNKISKLSYEINRLEKQSDNLGKRILFLLIFWKV